MPSSTSANPFKSDIPDSGEDIASSTVESLGSGGHGVATGFSIVALFQAGSLYSRGTTLGIDACPLRQFMQY